MVEATGLATALKQGDIPTLRAINVHIGSIFLKNLSVPITDHQVELFQNVFPMHFEADISFISDDHKILPYQPVATVKMKSLITKDKS